MENIGQMNNNKKIQDEVRALKDDMQSILSRLSHLKDQSQDVVKEQFGEIISKMSGLGGQGLEKGKEYYSHMEECVKKEPLKSALYAFGAGVILAFLLKR
jgi:ElaB/YqjD/DUF883 family membrane-anchored ribosome-binding protein